MYVERRKGMRMVDVNNKNAVIHVIIIVSSHIYSTEFIKIIIMKNIFHYFIEWFASDFYYIHLVLVIWFKSHRILIELNVSKINVNLKSIFISINIVRM
jgi:hypothetical protein